METVGVIFALIGVAFSVVWLFLMRSGVTTLKDIRRQLADREEKTP